MIASIFFIDVSSRWHRRSVPWIAVRVLDAAQQRWLLDGWLA
jgi:hypothetical protein